MQPAIQKTKLLFGNLINVHKRNILTEEIYLITVKLIAVSLINCNSSNLLSHF